MRLLWLYIKRVYLFAKLFFVTGAYILANVPTLIKCMLIFFRMKKAYRKIDEGREAERLDRLRNPGKYRTVS